MTARDYTVRCMCGMGHSKRWPDQVETAELMRLHDGLIDDLADLRAELAETRDEHAKRMKFMAQRIATLEAEVGRKRRLLQELWTAYGRFFSGTYLERLNDEAHLPES
jgi:hypothetical protein